MSKDNQADKSDYSSSPIIAMMNDIKKEILNQVKAMEASMKADLRSSIESTNAKVTTLTNTVKENSDKIVDRKV